MATSVLASSVIIAPVTNAYSKDSLSLSEKYQASYAEKYTINKNYIQKGETANIILSIVDPNITSSVSKPFVKMSDTTSFTCKNTDGTINVSSVNYDPSVFGSKIEVVLDEVEYVGEGHDISFSYGFEVNG